MSLWGVFFFIWTLVCYAFAKKLFIHTRKIYFSPIIVVPILSILSIIIFQRTFQDYYTYTQYLVAMLGPITVAFAIPVFRYRTMIRKYFKVLIITSSISMLIGILSSWCLANLFNIEQIVKNSLLARSISIHFALILTEKIDGSISLIPLFTVITGLVGMLFGDLFLMWMRYQHRIAHGAAFGNAAHAMGIARAQQRHSEEGVVASLSMIISGIIMVLFAPPVIALIKMLS